MRQYKYLDKITGKEFNAVAVHNVAITAIEVDQIANAFADQTYPVGILRFTNTHFDPSTFTQIMRVVHLHPTLRELYLDNVVNPDGEQGEQEFINALGFNIELNTITIAHYTGSKGFFSKLINEALTKCINLCELDLVENKINTSAANAIATLLRRVPTLSALYLGGNYIDDAGAQIIAAALRENRTLGGIDISYNQITVLGWQAIIVAFADNLILQEIRHGDDLSPEQTSLLQLISQRNQLIYQLNSSREDLRREGIEGWFLAHPQYNEDAGITQQERELLSETRRLDNEIRARIVMLTPEATMATRLGIDGHNNSTNERQEEEQSIPPAPFFFGNIK